MTTENFRHKVTLKVQFHEIDLLGVCNNAIYFNFFETARLEYLKAIGQYRDMNEMATADMFYLMAHNDCDYMEPAYYDDELNIYTRISYIKNSSFGFEHIVEKTKSGRIIAKGGGVIVHINRSEKKSIPLPADFYESVLAYDKNVRIIRE